MSSHTFNRRTWLLHRRTIIWLFVLFLAGCESTLTLGDLYSYRDAKVRWDASNIRSYTYETKIGCFCPTELGQWSRVTVIDGRVSGVFNMETQVVVDSSLLSRYPTIDDQFAFILGDHSGDVDVEYDCRYGYPIFIRIEANPEIIDSGFERMNCNFKTI